jgi:predicted aminopeptidase
MKTNRAISMARAREEREKCRDWLIPHMCDGKPKALTKDQYRELARQQFACSTAAFNDAWIWAIEDTGSHDWYEAKGRE